MCSCRGRKKVFNRSDRYSGTSGYMFRCMNNLLRDSGIIPACSFGFPLSATNHVLAVEVLFRGGAHERKI
jgi:hypothetical protein